MTATAPSTRVTSTPSTTRYLVIGPDRDLAVDGEIFAYGRLLDVLPHLDHDSEIVAVDLDELLRDGAASMRVVTEDVVVDWWLHHGGAAETYALIELDREPPLAARFFTDECTAYEAWRGEVA